MMSTRLLAAGCGLLLATTAWGVPAGRTAKGIAWRFTLKTAMQEAKRIKKPVMLDLGATWCGPCRALDERTYSRIEVVRESRKWVPVKIDIDAQPEIAARYGLKTPPLVAFLKSDGTVVSKCAGYTDAAGMVKQMKSAYDEARRK